MRRFEKMIKDPVVISAMLDTFNTAYVGFNDVDYPYVVPLSFGYEIKDEKLYIYVHSALSGYKLELMERDPRVCVSLSTFYDHHDHPYKSFIHDYRSVMAFGTISKIDKKDTEHFKSAVLKLLGQYGRDMSTVIPGRMLMMEMYEIVCDWDMVFGKTERPVRKVEDVPYTDVYSVPEDNTPYYTADLLSRKIDNRWPRRNGNKDPEIMDANCKEASVVTLDYKNDLVDCDIMAFLLNEKGIIWERNDIIFYNYPKHPSGAVTHSGDDKITGRPECLTLDFSKIPEKYTKVVILSSIYDAGPKNQLFKDAGSIQLKITEAGETVYECDIAKKFPSEWGLVIGSFVRDNGAWHFEKEETETAEFLVAELSERYGIRRDWRFILKTPHVNHEDTKGIG